MSLVFKCSQIVSTSPLVLNKPWDMPDKQNPGKIVTGVSNYCDVMCIGTGGGLASIRLKGKDENAVKEKLAKYTLGKPAEIPVVKVVSVSRGVMSLEG